MISPPIAFAILIEMLVLPEPVGPKSTIVLEIMLFRNAPSRPSLRGSVAPYFPRQEICSSNDGTPRSGVPTISLKPTQLKDTWQVEKRDDGSFLVTGEKIEKFARRTDMNNYASVNRLRDIMKILGIRAELTSLGAEPDSIIEIAGKQFTLVEDW